MIFISISLISFTEATIDRKLSHRYTSTSIRYFMLLFKSHVTMICTQELINYLSFVLYGSWMKGGRATVSKTH